MADIDRRDKDASVRVLPGEKIKIGSYTLAIKTKADGNTRNSKPAVKKRGASGKRRTKKRRG